jgi:hypothetical protein
MNRVSASFDMSGSLLDDADLEQEVGRFLREMRVLALEEFLVRGAVLPAQIFLRRLELLAALLSRRRP